MMCTVHSVHFNEINIDIFRYIILQYQRCSRIDNETPNEEARKINEHVHVILE